VNAQAHVEKAARHSATADAMSDAPNEWEIVVRFYAALHLVQAYLVDKGLDGPPENHGQRSKAIRDNTELSQGRGRAFRTVFDRLKSVSEQVRYDAGFTATTADIEKSRTDLATADAFIRPKLR